MARLTGTNDPIPLQNGYSLRAPGLVGRADQVAITTGTRAPGPAARAVDEAAAAAGMNVAALFDIEIERALPQVEATRGTAADVIELRTPRITDGMAALHKDENDVYQWILPEPGQGSATRGGGSVRFLLPRSTIPPRSAQSRGVVGLLGERLVRVLTWATSGLIGKTARLIAQEWEEAKRPYRLVQLDAKTTPGQLRADDPDWHHLTTGTTLLFIHGTFVTWGSAFAGLPPAAWKGLHDAYEGRILAFNHPTMHQTPQENVQWLLDKIEDRQLELDIITHSRGGLVGRHLAERIHEHKPSAKVTVRRGFLVAAPNRGTVLADAERDLEVLNRYTNLVAALPDNVAISTLEGVLLCLKVIGCEALKGLPGLQAMNPDTRKIYETGDHPPARAEYTTLAANWTAHPHGLLERLGKRVADRFIDSVFAEPNDFVVPTSGSHATDPPGKHFAPKLTLTYDEPGDDVHHGNYFEQPRTRAWINEWANARVTSD